jgi:hypothetical protein
MFEHAFDHVASMFQHKARRKKPDLEILYRIQKECVVSEECL